MIKLKKKKIDTYVYVFVALFPIALVLLQVFRLGTFELSTISDSIYSLIQTPFIKPIYEFFTTYILGGVNNLYINIAFGYIAYLVYVMLMFLIFDVFLWFIKFCQNLIDKFFTRG